MEDGEGEVETGAWGHLDIIAAGETGCWAVTERKWGGVVRPFGQRTDR